MSRSQRDHDNSSNGSSSHSYRTDSNNFERYSRKRSHTDTENLDSKVYVGNILTEKLTDEELLDFFKPYGKVSDIRVFREYVFVQYNRIDDAKKLLKASQIPLTLKGQRLEILPAREAKRRSSSLDRTRKKSYERISSTRETSNYEPSMKRFSVYAKPNFNTQNSNDSIYNSSVRSDSREISNDLTAQQHSMPYTILTGPKNPNKLVDCQIIIVNSRQRNYAEEIESRLCCHGLLTSIILLREDCTLIEAIENATRLQFLYGIIVMPMHEERRTASFHILYGQTEEHRNLALDDGIHIILSNFTHYKERFHSDDTNSYNRENVDINNYSDPTVSNDCIRSQKEELNPPLLHADDKLPLSMLLCLLADGRQLTLDEIDRVLVYLLEKKSKMLMLPSGTLPPLPARYATITTCHNQTGSGVQLDTRSMVTSDASSSGDISSTIAEQIRQLFATNIIKPNMSTGETNSSTILTKNSLDKLQDIVKIENKIIPQLKNDVSKTTQEYVQQQPTALQNMLSYSKSEALSIPQPSFNYSSSSVSSTGTTTPFVAQNFSAYSSVNSPLTLNSAIKPATTVKIPNFISQPSQYFYQIPSQNVYQSTLNSIGTDSSAAILQAYSQFNVQPTVTPSIVSQPTNGQQQIIRK